MTQFHAQKMEVVFTTVNFAMEDSLFFDFRLTLIKKTSCHESKNARRKTHWRWPEKETRSPETRACDN